MRKSRKAPRVDSGLADPGRRLQAAVWAAVRDGTSSPVCLQDSDSGSQGPERIRYLVSSEVIELRGSEGDQNWDQTKAVQIMDQRIFCSPLAYCPELKQMSISSLSRKLRPGEAQRRVRWGRGSILAFIHQG